MKVALTIAGSDPSGGAGIQADIKAFAALGVYGTAVPAALTAQGTTGVVLVREVPAAFLRESLNALLDDVRVDAAKTGMLLSAKTISVVSDAVRGYGVKKLVIDPVMVSSSGKTLLKKNALAALIGELFPLALMVTPNIAEASVLSGIDIKDAQNVKEAARRIRKLGPKYVLIKGGHLVGDAVDVLFDGRKFIEFRAARISGKELHGAGCVYSAAITAGLAKGMSVPEAVGNAKGFVTQVIKKAEPVGKGRTPLI